MFSRLISPVSPTSGANNKAVSPSGVRVSALTRGWIGVELIRFKSHIALIIKVVTCWSP